jgi:hypothetical protein
MTTSSHLPAARLRGLRRASLAAFVLVLVEYGFGSYVNLYVAIPAADRGSGIGKAVSDGPAALGVHAVLGLLLILAALGLLVQAVIARHWPVLAVSAVALFAVIGAAAEGASFVSRGQAAASMTMAVLAGVALLCYGVALYLTPSRRP